VNGVLAQESGGGGSAVLVWIIAVIALYAIAYWKIFTKAGQPGWASLIPFYNVYIILKIVGREGWWLILYFIPIVSFVIQIIVAIDLAKSFGKGAGFGIGLAFLPFIFGPILGFGDASYQGPAAAAGGTGMAAPPPPPPPPAMA